MLDIHCIWSFLHMTDSNMHMYRWMRDYMFKAPCFCANECQSLCHLRFSSCTHHFSHRLLWTNSEVKPSRTTLKQHKDSSLNSETQLISMKNISLWLETNILIIFNPWFVVASIEGIKWWKGRQSVDGRSKDKKVF